MASPLDAGPHQRSDPLHRPASRTGLASAVVGVLISAYLTIEHFTGSKQLACPESATVNCAKVTTSQWSHLAGIPVAVLGLAYFAGMTLALLPAAWRRPGLDPIRVAAAAAGVLMALYLVWIELFRVDAVCLWCTAVHVVAVILLGAVLWHTSLLRAATDA